MKERFSFYIFQVYFTKLDDTKIDLCCLMTPGLSKDIQGHVHGTDGLVVREGVSVTWSVLSWSGGREFEPQSGRTWST